MVALPSNEVTPQDLKEWFELDAQISALKNKEILLRNKIYKHLFVHTDEHGNQIFPKEGTNSCAIAEAFAQSGEGWDGWVLKAQRVVNRSVDQASLATIKQERADLRETINAGTATSAETARYAILARLNLDELIRNKPELAVKEYRALTDEERVAFDEILVIKDGTPQMEIVMPKRKS